MIPGSPYPYRTGRKKCDAENNDHCRDYAVQFRMNVSFLVHNFFHLKGPGILILKFKFRGLAAASVTQY